MPETPRDDAPARYGERVGWQPDTPRLGVLGFLLAWMVASAAVAVSVWITPGTQLDEIKADLRVGAAEEAGLKVRTGDGEVTVIGYDAQAAELYVDRTRSGRVDFSRDFPGVQRAPLTARHGKVRLRILVDWSSVEVFADRGQTVITDQIFPNATSDRVELFADGGSTTLDSLKIRHLRSSWATSHHNG